MHFAGFASTTHLTQQDVYALTDMFKKYPFIGRIKNDINIGGECTDEKNSSYPCTALEFYLPLSLLVLWFSDPAPGIPSGYMYIPFALTDSNQAYFSRYFMSVKEIAPNWYSFTGQHF